MPRIRKAIPGVDPKLLVKDAVKLMPDPARRAFLRGGASVGALAMLTGCGYQLQGRVVQGGFGTISLVDPTDQRLQVQGVPGVRVQLVRSLGGGWQADAANSP